MSRRDEDPCPHRTHLLGGGKKWQGQGPLLPTAYMALVIPDSLIMIIIINDMYGARRLAGTVLGLHEFRFPVDH